MESVTFAMNIGAALLMGMAIGLERQFRQHPAGLRTNALVCVGAALFVSVSRMIEHESSPTRVAAQVVSGIGFLGGGVILREGLNVRGLATAATMWCSAAVGTLAGLGFVIQGAIGTGVVLFVHLALRPLVRKIEAKTKGTGDVETFYRVRVVCPNDQLAVVRNIFMRHVNSQPTMTVQGISTQDTDQPERSAVLVEIFATERNDKYMNDLVSRICIEPSVSSVSWEKTR
ncbi:MAG TPA: MgtC/SapB family protein [Planctomycetaceae bacterium]|jgi:putative Mg2+ transporter-C (MgtC) family protein|nr:MgtC/SapB family protein [Planctomycetaceae bacterium]